MAAEDDPRPVGREGEERETRLLRRGLGEPFPRVQVEEADALSLGSEDGRERLPVAADRGGPGRDLLEAEGSAGLEIRQLPAEDFAHRAHGDQVLSGRIEEGVEEGLGSLDAADRRVAAAREMAPLPVAVRRSDRFEEGPARGEVGVLDRHGRRGDRRAVGRAERAGPLSFGDVLLPARPLPRRVRDPGLAEGNDRPRDERKRGEGHARGQAPVAPGELPELVEAARGAGEDRLVAQGPPQVAAQFPRRRVAALLLLLDRLPDDRGDVAAELAAHAAQPDGVLLDEEARHLGEGSSLEVVGHPSGEELVGDHAERVDVGAGVDRLRPPRELLGAHVGERAHDLPGAGVERRRLEVGLRDPGDAEVEDLRLAAAVDEDVAGLEVAVDHPLLVGVLDGVADPREELEARLDGEPESIGAPGERLPLDPLHGEEGLGPARRLG
ncbi:MAG: hypothetical protein L0323_07315 [Planctomycetes bacterium]|nr:hypothetical protein [Planctomycetota bacterium]